MLEALWELLLQAILQALSANRDVSADFYGRFHFTLEVGSQGALGSISPRPSPCCPSRTLSLPGYTTAPLAALHSYSPNTLGHPVSTAIWPQVLAFPKLPGEV